MTYANQGATDLGPTNEDLGTATKNLWSDVTHGEWKNILGDIVTEAQAGVASGDVALARMSRTVGALAALNLHFVENTPENAFPAPKTVTDQATGKDTVVAHPLAGGS